VVVETAGLEITIVTRLGFFGLTGLGSLRLTSLNLLIEISSDGRGRRPWRE
jgi:hypothetical protein